MGGNVQAKMTSVAATKAVRAPAERVGNRIAFTGALEGWAKAPTSRRSGCKTLDCSKHLLVNFQGSVYFEQMTGHFADPVRAARSPQTL